MAADPRNCSVPESPRRVLPLSVWRFRRGETPGAEAPTFDDSAWETVRTPHDWAIEGPFNPEEWGGTAKLPWRGEGRYRTRLAADAMPPGACAVLQFDGVMAFPEVSVNGRRAGGWDYGYMSFEVDATPHLIPGAETVISVRVDTRKHGSRWYPGAGIYRPARVLVTDPVHIPAHGIRVTTPHVTGTTAAVRVEAEVANRSAENCPVDVCVEILDREGRAVAAASAYAGEAGAGGTLTVSRTIPVPRPRLWDVDEPYLYTARVAVRAGGRVRDVADAEFGIRSFAWTADDGFHLNGRRVPLKGVNLHHDHGPLGAAFLPRAAERQLEILKDMGVNAIRTSHNPPAPGFLDLCDRLGLVVFNECFDKWNETADLPDEARFEEHMARQVRAFVRRDRNHPCVMVWSIGNEIADVETGRAPRSREKVAFLAELFRSLDPFRPVAMGCFIESAVRTGILDPLDLTGWNYGAKYLPARDRWPSMPLIYTESASAVSTRGFYELPHPTRKDAYSPALQVDSYDLTSANGPRDIPDIDFLRMERDRYCAGEFVWTGFDYLGEPTPFDREARSSYFGIVDLCGFPKDRFYLYRSHWRPEQTTVHILPHWNWPERLGQSVPVFVYTNGDEAELFLNGVSLGRRRKSEGPPDIPEALLTGEADPADYYGVTDRYRLRWSEVPYEPGELQAVAYKDGRKIGEALMRTAGPPAGLRVSPDREAIRGDGDDLCYVTVEAVDAAGTLCPLADEVLSLSVSGPADPAAVGNGNPLSFEPFRGNRVRLFFGKALVILRARAGGSGTARVALAAEGGATGCAEFTVTRP